MIQTELHDARQEVFEAGRRMRLVVDSIRDYAIFMLDSEGHIATWNTGAKLAKGYTEAEIVGKSIDVFYTPEDRERGLPGLLLGKAAREGRVEDEGWRLRKDGTKFWADVVITAILGPSGAPIGFVKVTRDLTERRRADEERLRLTRAEEAVRIRDEFLSIASHELRTPLTALKLQLDGLRERIAEMDGKTAKKVERAVHSVERLDQLVESLLDVSRIATGKFALHHERMDMSEALRCLVDGLRALATKVGCAATFSATDPVLGSWDRVRVEQLVLNLLANALKYGAGKPIGVSVSREGNDVLIEVRDEGPGIPEAALERIFGRFERAVSTRHYGGLGLGLYIAREIAQAHGGAISAQNLASGGASLTVRLPLEPAGSDAAATEVP